MAEAANTIEESTEALFDVVVKVPSGARLDDIEKLALGPAGIRPDRVESLIKALRSVPQAKIGAAVPRARADAAKEQFSKAGLTVEITPVLSLQVKTEGAFDGLFACPACRERVTLPENRQCPNCGVFVDKMNDEALLRKKILEQERAKLDFQASRGAQEAEKTTREALEARLRAEVRAELEAKYGLKKDKKGSAAVKGAVLMGLLAAVFIGGRGTSAGWSWEALTGAKPKDAGVAAAGPGGAAAGPGAAGAAGAAVAAAGAAGPAGAGASELTGDPDIDDPLVQAAGGKRIGAKGISMEDAVKASMVLAKSVGNTTAERALAGAPVGGPGGPGAKGGAGAAGGSAGAASGSAAAPGAAAGDTPGAAGAASANAASDSEVPPRVKQMLALDFTRQLAEMGQLPRATQMMKSLNAAPATTADPATAAAARQANLEVRAWGLHALGDVRGRSAADALMAEATALTDAAERAVALSRIGVIVARHPQLPADSARAFLTKAAEALKAAPDTPQRAAATSIWAVSFGESLLADAAAKAKAGLWAKVQQDSSQLDTLIAQAPDGEAQARLHALAYQMKLQLGQQDKAAQHMDAALALAAKVGGLPERAALLRDMARLAMAAAHDKLQAAAAQTQAQAMGKKGMERGRALVQLSLLNAEAGLRAKAGELADAARASQGLTREEGVLLGTDLIVRSDLASARVLHSVGLYAESETVLQRLGSYLL